MGKFFDWWRRTASGVTLVTALVACSVWEIQQVYPAAWLWAHLIVWVYILWLCWFLREPRQSSPRSPSVYYILFRDSGRVVAAPGPIPIGDLPSSLLIRGVEYLPLLEENTFFFWDELRDRDGATVGYSFVPPESPTFRDSYLIRDSENVTRDGDEIRILLSSCDQPEWECVQGFGSQIYACETDRRDCVIYMLDWSQNQIAFPLQSVV